MKVAQGERLMLVLTRKPGQSIMIDELGIEIVVVRDEGNALKSGVMAPKHIKTRRKELPPLVKAPVAPEPAPSP